MASYEDREQRIERLRAARTHRATEALAASHRAITALQARGARITWDSVAEAAGVSTSYLRKHPDLSERIRELSKTPTATTQRQPRTGTDNAMRGLRNKVEVMAERLRRYEADIAALRAENATLRGEIADLRRKARARTSNACNTR